MTTIAPSNSRGMGWRKPVPAFIPTPPTSRPTSETSFTLASIVSGGNAGKGPTVAVAGPENSQAPVSPPFPHLPRVSAESELTSFQKMPDNWLHIVRSASQDIYGGSNHIHLTPGSGIPERQLFYAVCHCSCIGVSPLFNDPLLGVFPECVFDGRPPPSLFTASLCCAQSCYPQGMRTFSRAVMGITYVFVQAFRPPTPPLRSARRPRSCAIPSMLERQTSLGGTYRMVRRLPTWIATMVQRVDYLSDLSRSSIPFDEDLAPDIAPVSISRHVRKHPQANIRQGQTQLAIPGVLG